MFSLDLANECLVKKTGFDSAENEPCDICPQSVCRFPSLFGRIPLSRCARKEMNNTSQFRDSLKETEFSYASFN